MAGMFASLPWGQQVNNTAGSSFGGVGGGTKNAGIGGVYSGAVHQQAGDYDKIMKNYQDMFSNAGGGAGGKYSPINAQKVGYNAIPAYQQSGQLRDLYGQLGGMSKTGGYSEEDIGNLRERGVAPTRAIYANAMRNMQRQRSLSGGYSPNFGALQAKMAREQAGIIGQQNVNVNADIAEKVAQGKQFALGQMSPIAMQGDRYSNDISTANAQGRQRVDELNARGQTEADMFNKNAMLNYQQQLANQQGQALQGMQSMYSATPGLVNTFGQQALQSGAQDLQGQLGRAQVQQNRANTGLQAIGNLQQPQMLDRTKRTLRIPGMFRP
jgi:hypothetical protein